MRNIFIKIFTIIALSCILFAGGSKRIVVDVSTQMAYAYEGKQLIYGGWASTGQKKYKTPTGRYRVLAKEKEHISNQWPKPNGGAKMPYMLRLTWSGIALHSGYTPNYPASHGCVRLQKDLAKNIFNWAKIGTKVLIKGKLPKRVARRGKGFINYIAKSKKQYRIANRVIKKSSVKTVAKVSKKYRVKQKVIKKRLSKKDIRIVKYSKYSHKQLNRLIQASYRKKNRILKSKKLTKREKIKKLRALKREVKILKAAKSMKFKKHKKHRKRLAQKLSKKRVKKS